MATLKESLVTVSSRTHIEDGEDQASYKCKSTAKTLTKQSLANEKWDKTRDWGMDSKRCRSEKAKYYERLHGSSGFEELLETITSMENVKD
jgi:hypothetical protein